MHSITRPLLACGLLLALLPPALAQAPAAPSTAVPEETGAQPGARNQTIQRIRTEDAGSRIDELRVGGQTQQITVQPKNDMPAYEVRPGDATGSVPSGMRLWNFKTF